VVPAVNQPDEAARGFRIRWWMWVIAGVLVIATAIIALRIGGSTAYKTCQHELRLQGYATTMEELVARGPNVDADRQDRLYRLMDAKAGWLGDISTALPFSALQEARHTTADLAKRDRALADGLTTVSAISAVLAEGPVELSVFGWCERDPAKLRRINVNTAAATRLPNLLTMRALTNWWSIHACLDADPASSVASLDTLMRGLDHPGTLIDAMIGIACRSIRDQTYLWLSTRGRLSDAQLRTWAAEPPKSRIYCASGYAGERCIFQEPLSRMSWRYSDIFGTPSGILSNALLFVQIWPMQGHEAAYCTSAIAACEAELLGQPAPPQHPMPFNYTGPMASIAMPNLQEASITATEADTRHRIMRCAGLVAGAYRRTGSLPETLPAAAPAASTDPNLPPLAYERLSSCRFRIGVDPAAPRPPIMPLDRWTPTVLAPLIGSPADTKAASDIRVRWSLEIDLDAILIPPPEQPAKKMMK
jgi:hypothetical protein